MKRLMMLIIIVGILTAIAVHLYTGYVERRRVTEAISIMGAIVTSQKIEKRNADKYYSASTTSEFKARGIDITDTKFSTYETAPTPNGGFTVTATPTEAFGAGKDPITLRYPVNYTYTEPHPMLWIEPIEPRAH